MCATGSPVGYKGQVGCRAFITLDAYAARMENFTTGNLPAGPTRLNPKYQPWTARSAVPAASRAAVEAAVLSASPKAAHNKGAISLAYAGRQGIDVGVDARIVSGCHWMTGVWDGDIPASQIVNLNAGYRLNPHLRVYANATNLFDQQRFQVYGGSVISRRVLAGMTSTF